MNADSEPMSSTKNSRCSCKCHVSADVLHSLRVLLPDRTENTEESKEINEKEKEEDYDVKALIQQATSYIQSLLPSSPPSIASPTTEFVVEEEQRQLSKPSSPVVAALFTPLPNPPAPNAISTASVVFSSSSPVCSSSPTSNTTTTPMDIFAPAAATHHHQMYTTPIFSPSPSTRPDADAETEERPFKRQRVSSSSPSVTSGAKNADQLVAMIEGATQETAAYRTQHISTPTNDTTNTTSTSTNKLDSLLQAIESATDSTFQYRLSTTPFSPNNTCTNMLTSPTTTTASGGGGSTLSRSEQWREYYQRLSVLQRTQFSPSPPLFPPPTPSSSSPNIDSFPFIAPTTGINNEFDFDMNWYTTTVVGGMDCSGMMGSNVGMGHFPGQGRSPIV